MSEGDLKAFSAMVSPDHNMNLITLTSKDTSSPHGDGTAAHLPLSVAKSRPSGHVTTSTNIRCTVHNVQVAQAKEDTGEGTVYVYESQGGLKPSTLTSIYVISPDPDEFSCPTEFSMDTNPKCEIIQTSKDAMCICILLCVSKASPRRPCKTSY